MTDTEKLKKTIEEKGIRISFIVDKLGISPQAFYRKLQDRTDFKAGQMFTIVDILNLTDEEAREIFFAPDVEEMPTK